MGQKVNPYGFRLGIVTDWKSRWIASGKEYRDFLTEDTKIREYLRKELERALRPDQNARLPAPLFVGLLGLVIATVVALGHPRRRGRLVGTASRSSVL